jgi:hypothetical protein
MAKQGKVSVLEAFESLNTAHGKITSYVGKRDAETVKKEVAAFKKTLQDAEGKWIKEEDKSNFRRFQSAVLMALLRRDNPKGKATGMLPTNPKKQEEQEEQETEQEATSGKTDAKQYTHNMISALRILYKQTPEQILALVKAELKIG